jgi:quinol monooxygenase YgiN
MAFVQIMEITTSKYEAVIDLDRQWRAATEGKRTLRREIVTRDRSTPNRFLIFAFFDSYESAMEDSNLPETQEFAAHFGEFTDGPPIFQDLYIIEDHA